MKKGIFYCGFIALFIFVLWLIYFNFRYNTDFFKSPVYTILNLGIAIFFAYYLTQRKNDERKLKEKAEGIIMKIQAEINNTKAFRITTVEDTNALLIMQRSINNRISILDDIKGNLSISKDVEYIKQKFQEYRDFTSNHINDIEYLTKSEGDLVNKIELIDNKLDKIIISLYK